MGVRFVDENTVANIARILSGNCDVIDSGTDSSDQSELLLEMDAQGLLNAHFAPGTVWEHATFGIGHSGYDDGYQPDSDPPDFFGDARTRQAIAFCLDRQEIVDRVWFGQSQVPDTYLPPGHPLFNPDAARYPYDPPAGMALLEGVGWYDHDGDPATPRLARGIPNVPEGTPLVIDYGSTSSIQRQQVLPLVAESLAGCGIQVNLEHRDAADFFEVPGSPVFERRFDMVQFAWLAGADPPCELFTSENIPGDPGVLDASGSPRFPRGWQGENVAGYRSPEFDQACRLAKATLRGQPEYLEYHNLAQQIFAQDLPAVPLYLWTRLVVTRPDLGGLVLDSSHQSEMWNIEEFDRLED